jgi:subtilisin family serine protease
MQRHSRRLVTSLRRARLLALLLLLPLAPAGAPVMATPPAQAPPARAAAVKYAPDRLLVRYRPSVPAARKAQMLARHDAAVVRSMAAVKDLHVLRVPPHVRLEDVLDELRKDPDVLYAELDYVLRATQTPLTPNDPRFGELWGLHNTGQEGGTADADIDAPEAWGITTGSSGVVIAVIDTGIDYEHPDLAANMFRNEPDCNNDGIDDDGNGFADDCHGMDFVNFDSDPMDDQGHGTHVAGTIGAVGNNAIGVVGVNWDVRLMACKFLDEEGNGFTSAAIACLDYLALMKTRGVNLVATNNSWGGSSFSQALRDAIDAHRHLGILFIASAGNEGGNTDDTPRFPSSYYGPNIISVAATDRNDALASFSNYGRRTVHLAAPGVSILSTRPPALFEEGYGRASGTSMAAPHVAGVAGLLHAHDPGLDWKEVKNLILAGADPLLPDSAAAATITQARLNAHGALTCQDSVVATRLLPPRQAFAVAPGEPVDLAFLHIDCAQPNGSVTVTVNDGEEVITLLDDGQGADLEAGDGVFSGRWTPSVPGIATLHFPGGDAVTILSLLPYGFSHVPSEYRSITGTQLAISDDESALLTPGFPLRFGGGNFDSLIVNENGNITFGETFAEFLNRPLPTTVASALVAPYWDDLFPASSPGGVFWEVLGQAPNRELVVEWRKVRHKTCLGDVTFQAVFFEDSSDILFNYADVTFTDFCGRNGDSATVGVQVSQNTATLFSFNSRLLADGSSIRWSLTPPPPYHAAEAPFVYRAITGTKQTGLITPGFPIHFGLGIYKSLFVNVHGNITFSRAISVPANSPLPVSPTVADAMVAPFWDRVHETAHSDRGIFWQVTGSAPDRELVVEWRKVRHGFCDVPEDLTYTFQVVFFENSTDILFNYADVTLGPPCAGFDAGASATVGLQISSGVASQYSFNTPSLRDELSLRWMVGDPPPAPRRRRFQLVSE